MYSKTMTIKKRRIQISPIKDESFLDEVGVFNSPMILSKVIINVYRQKTKSILSGKEISSMTNHQ